MGTVRTRCCAECKEYKENACTGIRMPGWNIFKDYCSKFYYTWK